MMTQTVKMIVIHPNLIRPLGVWQFDMIVFHHLIEETSNHGPFKDVLLLEQLLY
jgi:hypothetical protein